MHVLRGKSLPSYLFFAGILLTTLTSCELFWSPKSPHGYVVPRPNKMILEKKLNEISGLCYLPEENAFLTIADNKQKVYRVTVDGKVSNYFEHDFAKQDDFEDVVKVDSSVYVLVSDGTIIDIKRKDSLLVTTKYHFPTTDDTNKNDFETLYYDSTSKGLIMLCKECEIESGKGIRTAYRFDIYTHQFDPAPYYTIPTKSVADKLKDGKIDFHPSAAAFNPIDKRLYILSSKGHLLISTDGKSKVLEVFRLNPTLYPQAEGIAFASNGDMYITNEAKLGKPTLLRIPYKSMTKKR
ncbi:SdiA-regulated domain-containing protein [Flavisolibacter tropicus]|uniref:SdiA-regulated family protein n=1 Tax=Flavisolibacter tropicus TaxID=1492898 RepID=A0A172TWH0_9BACT|nr:SdiA-regulated domain-containing protein [Flavisolibacter tropicus]ANE51224.1 hypothetical protein SY85_12615 [Flavisolibacter tropicus]